MSRMLRGWDSRWKQTTEGNRTGKGHGKPVIVTQYATLSPNFTDPNLTLSNGNLTVEHTSATNQFQHSATTDAKAIGDWYAEIKILNLGGGNELGIGVGNYKAPLTGDYLGRDTNSIQCLPDNRVVYNNGSAGGVKPGAFVANDIVCVAVKAATNQVAFRVNGGTWSSWYTIGGGGALFLIIQTFHQNSKVTVNFGATPFLYTPPTGHSAWEANAAPSSDTWRVHWRSTVGINYAALSEVAMRIVSGGSNVLTGGTASAINTFSGSNVNNLLDGNTATWWASNATVPAWWQYVLPSAQEVIEAALTSRTDTVDQNPASLRIVFYSGGIPFPAYGVDGLSWSLGETKTFNWE